MKLNTNFFGEIDVQDDKIVNFADDMLGFEGFSKFLFMSDDKEGSKFSWLQCIDDVNIVLTMFNIFAVMPDYSPNVPIEHLEGLGEFEEEDLEIFCVAKIPRNVEEMSINLKAPIVINTRNNKAKQVIVSNDDYPIKYKIYEELKRKGE